jgi:hypothetical protein
VIFKLIFNALINRKTNWEKMTPCPNCQNKRDGNCQKRWEGNIMCFFRMWILPSFWEIWFVLGQNLKKNLWILGKPWKLYNYNGFNLDFDKVVFKNFHQICPLIEVKQNSKWRSSKGCFYNQ